MSEALAKERGTAPLFVVFARENIEVPLRLGYIVYNYTNKGGGPWESAP